MVIGIATPTQVGGRLRRHESHSGPLSRLRHFIGQLVEVCGFRLGVVKARQLAHDPREGGMRGHILDSLAVYPNLTGVGFQPVDELLSIANSHRSLLLLFAVTRANGLRLARRTSG